MSIARDPHQPRSASLMPPQIARESYRENHINQRVFTQPGSSPAAPVPARKQTVQTFEKSVAAARENLLMQTSQSLLRHAPA